MIPVLGIDNRGFIKIHDSVSMKTNQKVQFYQLDTSASSAHLKQSLLSESSNLPWMGALQFKCCARNSYFYRKKNVEAEIFRTLLPKVPLIGFECNGEISSLGKPGSYQCSLMGYTSVFGLISKRD